ncbi:hypothetical protein ACXFAU_04850 [Paenibacillus glucanolyticus]
MRKRRITACLLSLSVIIGSFSSGVSAETYESNRDSFSLQYMGNGVFGEKVSINSSNKSYKVKKKDDVIYELLNDKDAVQNYLIETVDGQYQLVGKKEINLEDFNSINNDDSLSDYIKEDIKSIIKKANETEQSGFSITVYTPNLLNNLHAYEPSGNVSPSGSTWLPPVYYTGKGSLRYKDEVLHITNYSTETGERKYSDKAEAQAEYKKLFNQALKAAAGEGLDAILGSIPAYGVVKSFIEIFGTDSSFGGDTDDKIKVYVVEKTKYRKYTSVMFPAADYDMAAVTDNIAEYEVYIDKIKNGVVTQRNQKGLSMKSPSWFSADQKAYEFKASLTHWNERIYYHDYFGMRFRSAS